MDDLSTTLTHSPPACSSPSLLDRGQVLCSVSEYNELPVRHNEDKINATMARTCRLPVDMRTLDDPHTKANLLLQV